MKEFLDQLNKCKLPKKDHALQSQMSVHYGMSLWQAQWNLLHQLSLLPQVFPVFVYMCMQSACLCLCVITHEPVNLAENVQKYNGLFYFSHQVVKSTLNPTWQKFSIPVRTLCNGDYDRNIKVVCYDWNSSGDLSHIGEFSFTLRQFAERPLGSCVFQCICPEKQVCVGQFMFVYGKLITLLNITHVMAHPQVEDGRNDLQLQRVVANVLNKLSQTGKTANNE